VTRRLIAEFARRPVDRTPAQQPAFTQLTAREREVLELVGRGLSNAQIAERLVLRPCDRQDPRGAILAKLQARDRAQLVVLACESGLVRPRTG
jgi:DNA-binding NarL/FixJ family response regulator